MFLEVSLPRAPSWQEWCLVRKYEYRQMTIKQDTACMFASCYDNKQGHLPVHLAKPAICPCVRVETDFASFFSRQGEGTFSSALVLADMGRLSGTAKVSTVQLYYPNIRQTCGTRHYLCKKRRFLSRFSGAP